MGVLNPLANSFGCFVEMPERALSWADFTNYNLVFFQRPALPNHLDIIKACKRFNVPVVIDYDDDLLDVPRYNRAGSYLDQSENIKECLRLADAVIVSTKGLKERWKDYCEAKVVHNAFNDFYQKIEKPERQSGPVFWRGTMNTSAGEIYRFQDQWREYNKANDVAYLSEYLPGFTMDVDSSKVSHFKAVDIDRYFQTIKAISPQVFIKPLADTPFNRCKSNITWIEATYAGAVCVASDLPEFNVPGCIVAPQEFFFDKVKATQNDHSFMYKHYQQSVQEIKKNWLLSKINKRRAKVLEEVMR